MKKILGLDLGVSSVGWSVIGVDENGDPSEILGMGSRIIPLSTDDANEFSTGNAISKNQKRTQKRTIRKGYDRYQLRRENLTAELRKLKMLPDEHLIKLPVMDLWNLRAKAATPGEKLELPEIGRVLYHINQKRGYKHAKADETGDKKQTDYVAAVNNRYETIQSLNQTVGQYLAGLIKASEEKNDKGAFYTFRTKDLVFPRKAYEAEFDQIIAVQKEFYPEILNDKEVNRLRNEIIFYQRNLKSCKHLVSLCEFEKRAYKNKDGKEVFDGPKVAPRTSPLSQICRIWEFSNNLQLENEYGEKTPLSLDQKQKVVDYLDSHEKMSATDFQKLFGFKRGQYNLESYFGKNGVKGNTTKTALMKALTNVPDVQSLLQFDLELENSSYVNESTGEVLKCVSANFEKQPLYVLWHTIYSIPDKEELIKALNKKFGFDEQLARELFKIDFVKAGFGNKSAKAMRRILPFLQQGMVYSEACAEAGYNHSNSLSTAENEARVLLNRLPQIKKNELRQPIVEKILNQMVNVVNAIYDEYGSIDEIRVELARELKQSKDERYETFSNIAKRERENKGFAEKIQELGLTPSKNKIQKYRLWVESGYKCFYCGQPVGAVGFLSGIESEVEHIVPKSLLFDDSQSNKVCSCRKCNQDKNNRTGFDFAKSKGEAFFDAYCKRVDEAFKAHTINRTKHDRLLTPQSEIPNDFIERQLRQTQYISKKSIEMLKQVCRNVYATSGSVTDFIRHTWGYDEILHDLNFDRYKQGGLTEIKEFEHRGQKHSEERIKDWSKRLDHRHHAIDALVIAMTRQSIIQRLNHLNSEREAMFQEVGKQSDQWQRGYSLLQQWLSERKHFDVSEVSKKVSEILVSFKAGKRVATIGKRVKYENGKKKVLQSGIVIPRGPLSEESVYGKIRVLDPQKSLKDLFANPEAIAKPEIKSAVKDRLAQFEGDVKKSMASLKKTPITLSNGEILEKADCYRDKYVIKYPLNKITKVNYGSIVDVEIKKVVEKRLEEHNYNTSDAFKEPIYSDLNGKVQIKTVRCFAPVKSNVVVVKKDYLGKAIGFAKPGNNHHLIIFKDQNGKFYDFVVTLGLTIDRKLYGLPAIVRNLTGINIESLPSRLKECLPAPTWSFVESFQRNEMVVLGVNDDEYKLALERNDFNIIRKKLYKVESLSKTDSGREFCFRLHTDTTSDDSKSSIDVKNFLRIKGLDSLMKLNPHKVTVSLLGKIIAR